MMTPFSGRKVKGQDHIEFWNWRCIITDSRCAADVNSGFNSVAGIFQTQL